MEFNQDIELIEALAAMYPNSKRNTLRKMLTSGRVTVDGKVTHKAKFIVEKGKQVAVSDRETAAISSPPPAPKKRHSRVKVLFEDEHIIVVNKQAGLLSVSTDKMEPDTLHSRVVDYLKSENEKSWAFIVQANARAAVPDCQCSTHCRGDKIVFYDLAVHELSQFLKLAS